MAELLGQVRAGVSTLAKARNTAVHGPLRAGKQKGRSPSEASTSQDELSDSTAEKKYAVASFEVVAPTGGSIGTGKGSSHVIGIRRGAGSSAEATAGLGAKVLEDHEDNELHVQQEKVSENKEYCEEVLENQELQELREQQRQAKVGLAKIELEIKQAAAEAQKEEGAAVEAGMGNTTAKAASPLKAQAKVLAGHVQGEGGATSGSSCSETLGSCDAEGVDSASDGEDVTETFSRSGLAKMELEFQQATTKGAKRIAKEALRVYKIELEDAEFDEMVRISRAEELLRVYDD
uniref:Uncharacterized protein n=1 Tax=Spumella elongata TaxID=89044 RepID=A0A7S3GUD4_9STRA